MSVLKLYRNCKITEDKNFQLDNIEHYLIELSPVKTINNFQYVKQGLDTEVKVNLDQTYLDKQWTNMYNYCSIELDDGGQDNTYYYFIREMKWLSKSAIKLVLRLDVLNTYKGAYKLSDKTTVLREHKDRYTELTYTKLEPTELSISHAFDEEQVDYAHQYTAVFRYTDSSWVGIKNITSTSVIARVVDFPQLVNIVSKQMNFDSDTGTMTITVVASGPAKIKATGTIYYQSIGPVSHNGYCRVIDKTYEGITPQLYHNNNDDQTLIDKIDQDWYLVYTTSADWSSTSDSGTTITTYLYPENQVKVFKAGGTKAIGVADMDQNYWYFSQYKNTFGRYQISNNATAVVYDVKTTGGEGGYDNTYYYVIAKRLGDNTIKLEYWKQGIGKHGLGQQHGTPEKIDETSGGITQISFTINDNRVAYGISASYNTSLYDQGGSFGRVFVFSSADTTETINDIKSVSRTDSRLIKIIKLAYCPTSFNYDADTGVLTILDNTLWRVANNKLEYTGTDLAPMVNELSFDNFDPLGEYIADSLPVLNNHLNKNPQYESKLFNSEFYMQKVYYDSFSFPFRLEDVDLRSYLENYCKSYIQFYTTTTINSRFMLKFPDYICKHASEDYNNILAITRNNEITLYNSPFLNYMRTGYNYDVKARNLQETRNIFKTATAGLAGSVAGAAKGAAGGPAGAIAGGVIGGLGGIAGGIVSNLFYEVEADNKMNEKLDTLKQQATSVNGSDDADLLDVYSENRLKYTTYKPTEVVADRLFDLFYYCGYKTLEQKTPDTTTRYWFNYLQCEPDFIEDNTTAKLGIDIKSELVNKLMQGITVLHEHYIAEDDAFEYDFEQKYENWETSLN